MVKPVKKRLDVLLVEKGLVESRAKAQALVMSGKIVVDGQKRDKPGWQTDEAAVLDILSGPKYVSRAGLKLESVNEKFKVNFKDTVVLDVGSSTGGFSDYALQNKADKVYAVDVGTHQLHERIRSNSRVVAMEKTDIRNAKLPELVDIALVDVSFISLRQVLAYAVRLVKPGGVVLAMCKPQFEAGVVAASKHKGVIKNEAIRREVLKQFELWMKESGFAVIDKADSKVTGAKGNRERFYLIKQKDF